MTPISDILLLLLILLIGPIFIRRPYLSIGFAGGYILTALLNIFLKWIIQQPRPYIDLEYFKTVLKNNKNNPFFIARHCGMPSGHAQLSGFALIYIVLSTHSWWIWGIMTLTTIGICIQRVATKAHTILQVLVGLFIGMGCGMAAYNVMVRFLKLK